MNRLPGGLWPVMLTPFKENNQIDEHGLEKLTNFYISGGAHGLFANCLSSEMFQLTEDERIKITGEVVKKVDGRIPVVSTGTFSADIQQNSDLIKKVYDTGVQAVVINSNQLVGKTDPEDAFKSQLEKLMAETGNIPLGMYECPVPYKRLISADLMSWMGDSGRFYYHKDTCCNLDQIKAKVDATKNTPLGIYNANTPTALESLRYGAKGLSPIGANFYPELYSYMIKHLHNRDERIDQLNDLVTVFDEIVNNQYYPQSAKIFLRERGLHLLPNTRLIKPFPDQEDMLKLNALLRCFSRTIKQLNISPVNF